mmetsp:Transcript_30866/g.62603  ORF Transcript_30866/g.62603 Transcript_30866/m.62603 type:complete len:95 (-) Transcript_30866:686-970(-)
MTTLVCVKKEALAASVNNRPTFTRPCVKKFHTASSTATMRREARFFSSESVTLSSEDTFIASLLICGIAGRKQAAASQPLVALSIAGVGGPGCP